MAPTSVVQEMRSLRGQGLTVVKSSPQGALPIDFFSHFCCMMYRLATKRTEKNELETIISIGYTFILWEIETPIDIVGITI